MSTTTATTTITTMEKKSSIFLPKHSKPVNYKLHLTPDLEKFIFIGTESIEVIVEKATATLTLHSNDCEIHEVTWTQVEVSPLVGSPLVAEVEPDPKSQTVVLRFSSELPIGKGILFIKWTGQLNDNLAGFYRSSYVVGEEKRYMAVTQFEPTDARRCFPCWDEPAAKATFDVTLVVPFGLDAISNMPVIERKTLEDRKTVSIRYDTTPKMSTYLLAFIIGEFDFISVLSENDVRTTVYTPRGKSKLAEHALFVASKALPFYEKLFGIKYPLPKSDLLAIPDFAAGAMENWGAVTYRETRLLFDSKHSSILKKTRTTRTVCHELAHMWFGNLVTMQWWTHLWLNEGFARFMEFLAVDHIFPEWNIWLTSFLGVVGTALRLDALDNTHPVEVEVGHPSEIDEIFDTISYAKGASIIRMLHNYLGGEIFMNGVRIYLQRKQYDNALTEDLWDALSEASSKPIKDIMTNWTKELGYPVITIKEEETKDGKERVFTLSQSRFRPSGTFAKPCVWQCPIRISTEKGKSLVVMMNKGEMQVQVTAEKDEWICFNTGRVGFFRCNYSISLLEQLAHGVAAQTLPPADRLALQSDVFAMANAGLVSMESALSLLQHYKGEHELPVLESISSSLSNVMTLYADDGTITEGLSLLAQDLFAPLARELGWEAKANEPATAMMKRQIVFSILGRADHSETLSEAKRYFAAKEPIGPDLRGIVYKCAIIHGGEDEYNKLLQSYSATDSATEKRKIMICLGAATKVELQKKTLAWALTENVRLQDKFYPVSAVARSKGGNELVWSWFVQNFSEMNKNSDKGDDFLVSSLVGSVSRNFHTFEKADEIQVFFEKNEVPSAARTIQQSLEKIRKKATQRKRDMKNLQTYFVKIKNSRL